jgi:hypothetical protein
MKRLIIAILLFTSIVALAQVPSAMIDKCVSAINAHGGVTATFTITSPQGSDRGTISMRGNKFRIISKDAKCWYDGKTLWSWSSMTNEVNITTPTAEELQMTNPMAAVSHLKTDFNMKRAKAQTPKTWVIRLTPKKKDNIKTLWLYFDETTSLLRTARFEMKDKSLYVLKISDYKQYELPASTFTFDKSKVPAGTQVVDLR